tara:strand:+ start:888 stop:1139 length:252 start_codon:yes stop_codon:yes gene_type:complete
LNKIYKQIKVKKGTNKIFKFPKKLSCTNFNELSEKIIIVKPLKNIIILYLLYDKSSFEFKSNKSEVRIKIGIYNGIINLLYNS